MAKKYANINFTPPQDVRQAARQGLKLHEDGKTGSGLEPITVSWARRIANGEDISPDKAKQGNRWWGRNKRFLGFPKDSPAYAAAMLWFGRPGQRWMAKLTRQMEAEDMINKSLAALTQQVLTVRGAIENNAQNGVLTPSVSALIQKIGARHTSKEIALIQKLHDMALSLGAECHPLTRRAGARHSAGDQVMVQRIHDDCAALGATCKALPERDRLYHSQVMKEGEIIKGSAGSGNYGHDGRPGKLGGSTKGGGLRRIGAKKDSKPSDRKKASKMFRDKRKGKKQDKSTGSLSPGELNLAFLSAKKHSDRVKYAEALLKDFSDKTIAASLSEIPKLSKPLPSVGEISTSGKNAIFRTGKGAIEFGKVLQDSDGIFFNANFGKRQEVKPVFKSDIMVTKAQSDAPNYAPASTPQRCKNCKFFLGDPGRNWCERFDFTADPDYTCDAWEAQRPDEIPGYVANKADLARLTEGVLILRGGPTSGNWAHSGRPGKRGGSGSGGGFKRIGAKAGSSRKRIVQAAKKKQKQTKVGPKKPPAKVKTDVTKKPKGDGVQTGDVANAKKTTHTAMTKTHKAWYDNMPEVQKDALLTYSSREFENINGGLRGFKKLSGANRKVVQNIDKALRPLDEDTIVFRKMGSDVLEKLFGPNMKKWVGKEYSDKGYTSTSVNSKGPFPGVDMEIKVPKGTKAGYLGSHPDNVFGKSEQELLLGRNQSFRILKVRGGKNPKVFLELVQ